jgi:hypothetical protein
VVDEHQRGREKAKQVEVVRTTRIEMHGRSDAGPALAEERGTGAQVR